MLLFCNNLRIFTCDEDAPPLSCLPGPALLAAVRWAFLARSRVICGGMYNNRVTDLSLECSISEGVMVLDEQMGS
jgi:hypothetical protein